MIHMSVFSPADSVVFAGHFHDRLTKTVDGRTLEVLPAYANASELAFYDPAVSSLEVFPADALEDRCAAPDARKKEVVG